MGSLYRRLRNCMVGVRAEPFEPGSPDLVNLEFYLAGRAAGLPVETPAVRP
jgi:sulfur-oxidizing protein SoxA